MTWTPERLFAVLDELAIGTTTVTHRAVFTVEEARELRDELPGAHTKSLFLRDKKGRLALVTMDADRRADLATIATRLGTGRLSFGSPRRLADHLGVEPGSVSPFAVVNDPAGDVTVALDRALLAAEVLWLHPLVNTMSTAIAPRDLVRFLEAVGHPPATIDPAAAR